MPQGWGGAFIYLSRVGNYINVAACSRQGSNLWGKVAANEGAEKDSICHICSDRYACFGSRISVERVIKFRYS